jgi:hypothetical protein
MLAATEHVSEALKAINLPEGRRAGRCSAS